MASFPCGSAVRKRYSFCFSNKEPKPCFLYYSHTILILNDYKDAERRSAEGDASPVASPPKAEVENEATMTAKPFARLRRGEILLSHTNTILILNDYKDAERRIAKGDASPVASPPKAEVESEATMTAKPFARLRRGEILLPHIRICFRNRIV